MLLYLVQEMIDIQANTCVLTVRSRFHSMSALTHHHLRAIFIHNKLPVNATHYTMRYLMGRKHQ
jgi:hypothetical protein